MVPRPRGPRGAAGPRAPVDPRSGQQLGKGLEKTGEARRGGTASQESGEKMGGDSWHPGSADSDVVRQFGQSPKRSGQTG